MAIYGINKEGAEALKQLSTDLRSLNNDIAESCKTLHNKINGLSNELGIYEKPILEVLKNVLSTQKRGSESIDILATKAAAMSQRVEFLVSSGFVQ